MKKIILALTAFTIVATAQPIAVRNASGLPSYKTLKFPPLRQIRIPEPATVTLKNGIKVYLLEDHELPVVSGFALVRTGNLFDPNEKRGLLEITGEVLRAGGTKTKTGDQLDEELESIAASVESRMGETSSTVSFSTLKENTDRVLAVYKEVLTSPEFRQDKIDLAKTQLRSSIARRNDDPHGIVNREFSNIIYGRDTPYGWNIEYENLDHIQRADLIAFYQRYYFPANIMLAIYGDFSTAEMKSKLDTLFADWTPKQQPVPAFAAVRDQPAPGVFLAAKPDVTQTFFAIGHLGGLTKDKDYPALEVAADILGGGFTSRLFRKVRTELGYAYAIGAGWAAAFDHPGLFRISGSTKSASTTETIAVVRQELDKLRNGDITDQELKTAKDTVENSFVFSFDRPSKTLNRLMQYEYYGYPKDFIFQYQKAVAAVTKADVARVAKQYFKPENLTIVAVGNPEQFGKPLSALDLKVQPIDLTIPEPKREAAKSDASSLAKGKELLQRAQQSLGGAAKLAAIKDMTRQLEAEVQTGQGAMKVKQHTLFIAPNIMRQDQELPFGKITIYSDGKTGWLSTPQGVQPMPAPVLKQMQGELFREFVGLLLSDRDPERTVNYAGDGVLEISNKSGESVKLKVDERSGLPLRETYQLPPMGGPSGPVDEVYSDWKEVGGIRVPFKIALEQGGKKVQEATVQEYKFNTGLKPEDLSKKP